MLEALANGIRQKKILKIVQTGNEDLNLWQLVDLAFQVIYLGLPREALDDGYNQ